jgi:uncharacterized protein YdeI (YjbR/CyaY-like superfamily)
MTEAPIKHFVTASEFEKWLSTHYEDEAGIWLQMYKKATGKPTVVYKEALDVALCYGWIDGQSKTYDAESYIQKFTPRRTRSLWSVINKGHVARLIKEKRMREPGLKEIERAKADGRWDAAYEPASTMKVPDDFIEEVKKDAKAYEIFQSLNKANTYAIGWNLQTAKKPETRERRKQKFLEMMRKGEKIH